MMFPICPADAEPACVVDGEPFARPWLPPLYTRFQCDRGATEAPQASDGRTLRSDRGVRR